MKTETSFVKLSFSYTNVGNQVKLTDVHEHGRTKINIIPKFRLRTYLTGKNFLFERRSVDCCIFISNLNQRLKMKRSKKKAVFPAAEACFQLVKITAVLAGTKTRVAASVDDKMKLWEGEGGTLPLVSSTTSLVSILCNSTSPFKYNTDDS